MCVCGALFYHSPRYYDLLIAIFIAIAIANYCVSQVSCQQFEKKTSQFLSYLQKNIISQQFRYSLDYNRTSAEADWLEVAPSKVCCLMSIKSRPRLPSVLKLRKKMNRRWRKSLDKSLSTINKRPSAAPSGLMHKSEADKH